MARAIWAYVATRPRGIRRVAAYTAFLNRVRAVDILFYPCIMGNEKYIMKWIAIAGSWRKTNAEIEALVRRTVRDIMERGDGIVSGGALGVDAIALNEAITCNPTAKRIRIFLPVTLETYAAHYRRRAQEGVITGKQAEMLIRQLTTLKEVNLQALIENSANEMVNQATYYERIGAIVQAADALVAFPVRTDASDGLGTQYTIEKAEEKDIPVTTHSLDLREAHIGGVR